MVEKEDYAEEENGGTRWQKNKSACGVGKNDTTAGRKARKSGMRGSTCTCTCTYLQIYFNFFKEMQIFSIACSSKISLLTVFTGSKCMWSQSCRNMQI